MDEKIKQIKTEIVDRLYNKLVVDKVTMSVDGLSVLLKAIAELTEHDTVKSPETM